MTLPERICFWTLVLTWPFYAIGALYVVGPVLAWLLGVVAILSLYLGPAIRPDLRAAGPVPPVVWAWIIGMFVMLVALWIGHWNWGLGLGATIKSTIGWAKGWAMIALFPLAGAVLPIGRQCLIRGQSIIGMCTLILLPLLFIAPYVGLPSALFTSPFKVVGGPGPEYFTVYLYTLDPSNGLPRWQFYAPWSPFAGLLGVVMVMFALEDNKRHWLLAGVVAGLAMIILSKSRMSLIALFVCTIGPRMMPLIASHLAWKAAAIVSAMMAVLGPFVFGLFQNAILAVKSARADSTRVRETLQRIGYDRWWNEAIWFGHGTVRPGPHLVEHMPIGSHHTWVGLLFVKGLVGFLAFLVPFIWQFAIALIDAAKGARGRLPLGIMLMLVILSFGENVEIEVYLLWPVFVLLGIHAREVHAGKTQ